MSYTVTFTSDAQRDLRKLPSSIRPRIKAATDALADDPRPSGVLKMSGVAAWRIRVGNYRVVYEIDDQAQTVTILVVGDRRDVYKRLP